jgi:hypothetical protein
VAFLGDQPQPELTTERVSGGRRAAVLAGLAAVLVIGAFIWKPWDDNSRTPDASVRASVPAVARATARPSPTHTPTQSPQPSAPITLEIPPPIGDMSWLTPAGSPIVTCVYESSGQRRMALKTMVVKGPSVKATADAIANPLRGVRWVALIQVNDLQSVFSGPWRSAAASQSAQYLISQHDQFTLQDATVDVTPDPGRRNAVFRAVAQIMWLGAADDILETQQTVATSYGPPNDSSEGCPAFTRRIAATRSAKPN